MRKLYRAFGKWVPGHSALAVTGMITCLAVACVSAPASDAPDDASAAQERLLPLAGADNVRDLGGYETRDGRTVRWGLLFRADSLARLTDEDLAYLEALKLAVVTDFRGESERNAAPDRLPTTSPAIGYRTLVVTDPAVDVSEIGQKVYAGQLTARELLQLTDRTAYVNNPEISRRWGRWVAGLADERNLPHLFHCTAGKDRTGFAAAIVLLTLGVTQEQVMEDFLLSNHYLEAKIDAGIERIAAVSESGVDADVLRQVLGVSPRSLEEAIAAMMATYGSVDGFVEQGLGIDAPTRTRLRTLLLE